MHSQFLFTLRMIIFYTLSSTIVYVSLQMYSNDFSLKMTCSILMYKLQKTVVLLQIYTPL